MWSEESPIRERNESPNQNGRPDILIRRAGTPEQKRADKFKREIIEDILSQLDYQTAFKNGVVDVNQKDIAKDLELLPTRTLVAWYESFLYIRSELMLAGYELNGLKILDRPANAVRKLMESDPDFDIRQYIF